MVTQVKLESNWAISEDLPEIHYWDAWQGSCPATISPNLAQLPILFFQAFPKWFAALLYLRESLVKWIGLKTAEGMDIKAQMKSFRGMEGESIALFRVMKRTEHEIMMGENDSHLDFRLSFIVESNESKEITLATTVFFHNWIGRIYFFFVRPIHRIIMPIIMKRIMNKISINHKSINEKLDR